MPCCSGSASPADGCQQCYAGPQTGANAVIPQHSTAPLTDIVEAEVAGALPALATIRARLTPEPLLPSVKLYQRIHVLLI
jgi:hypothetical protein